METIITAKVPIEQLTKSRKRGLLREGVDWNNDKLNDLVIGEGGGFGDAKVRVYLNVGTESNPQFSDYFYAQSNGSDLTCPLITGHRLTVVGAAGLTLPVTAMWTSMI